MSARDGHLVLVLGGTRSGKSAWAERLAEELAPDGVTYVATARVESGDADHAARVEAHRARRSDTWSTVECPDPALLPRVLGDVAGPVLLDSLGSWVGGHDEVAAVDDGPLLAALAARTAPTVVVSDEVGLAVHAPTELGRAFVDTLGSTNQHVSALADRAVLVVAGRALDLPPAAPTDDTSPRA